MIFKEKDSISDCLEQLQTTLQSEIPMRDRKRLEKELACRKTGLKGENEAAFHINFHLKDHPNWAVLHDLRIECKGRSAQIDHLLISRLLEIYVVESKSFHTKIRYANGGWERYNFNRWEGIPCPVQQNERHIAVLKDLITEQGLAHPRLGFTITPNIYNVVVVMPSCSVPEKHPEEAKIYRMDKLVAKVRSEEPSVMDVFRLISQETLHQFASKLAAYHRPGPKPKIVLSESANPPATNERATPSPAKCQNCGGPMQAKEARYCTLNHPRFGGQLLCRKCQAYLPKASPKATPTKSAEPSMQSKTDQDITCAECGVSVDQKVKFYCQSILKLPTGRILCRSCQQSLA